MSQLGQLPGTGAYKDLKTNKQVIHKLHNMPHCLPTIVESNHLLY